MVQPKIFICHSRFDQPLVSELASELESAGASVLSSTDVVPKVVEKRAEQVEAAISSCRWFLFVLTYNALASVWVREEVDAAIHLKNQKQIEEIIVFNSDGVDYGDFPTRWNLSNFLFVSGDRSFAAKAVLTEIGLAPTETLPTIIDVSPRYDIRNFRPYVADVSSRPDETQELDLSAVPAHNSQPIFISYRRDDSSGHAGRLRADLNRRYGESQIFLDLAIEPGVDFVTAIEAAVGSCAVLLAVIGRYWLTITDEKSGKRRLDSPNDYVRLEIATALERNIRVIPILVNRASMPHGDELPENLKPLARRHALEITDQRWDYDVGNLEAVLDKIIGFTR